jgi:hypothetical protein
MLISTIVWEMLHFGRTWWITPVILSTWEVGIQEIEVQDQHGQKFSKTQPQSISQV